MPILELEGKLTTEFGQTEFDIKGRKWMQTGDEEVAYLHLDIIKEILQLVEELNAYEQVEDVTDNGERPPIADGSEQFLLVGAWQCPNCGIFFKEDPSLHTKQKKKTALSCPACGFSGPCSIPKEIQI